MEFIENPPTYSEAQVLYSRRMPMYLADFRGLPWNATGKLSSIIDSQSL